MFRTLAHSTYSLAVRAHSSSGLRNFLMATLAVSAFAAQVFLAPAASAGVFHNTVLGQTIEPKAAESVERNASAHDCLVPIAADLVAEYSDTGSAIPLGSAADCAPLPAKETWI